MNEEKNDNSASRINDNYFNVVSLPMEKQHATTAEERKDYFENLKKRILGQYKPEPYEDKPLTTDVIGRGYPPRKEELDTIKKVNEYEKSLIEKDPNIKPKEDDKTNYFIVEDGKVFKTNDYKTYYELNTDSMEWVEDPSYMSIMYDTYLKFSKLNNFRDYYLEKDLKEEESRGLPR